MAFYNKTVSPPRSYINDSYTVCEGEGDAWITSEFISIGLFWHSNNWPEEALWEGVPLLARLPALNPAVGFLFQPLAWPVDFRSSAPHNNPPFLELATTSSPCQAMKLRDRALNLELPSEPVLIADPR